MTPDESTVRDLHSVAATGPFIPVTSWPALEEARERHERALAEFSAARREEGLTKGRHRAQHAQEIREAAGRVLDGEPRVDPAVREDERRRELDAIAARLEAARLARSDAVIAALRLVEAHPEWAAEIAERRAAAEAERDALLAQAAAANAVAHGEGHLERWLRQAATKATPQPFAAPGPPPPASPTIAEVFSYGGARGAVTYGSAS